MVFGSPGSASGKSEPSPKLLDLKTVQKMALAQNPSLQAALARVAQARERVRQARARYFPRLEAAASATHTRYPENQTLSSAIGSAGPALPFPLFSFPDQEDIYRASLTATWTLFDGFYREFTLSLARFQESQSRESLREAKRLLLSAVSAGFHRAQLAWETVAIADADETFNLLQLKDAKARETAGTGSLSDVLNFEVQVNLARAEKIRARREYETALSALAALAGLPEGRFPPGTQLVPLQAAPEPMLVPPDPSEHVRYALRHRPDIVHARLALEAARAAVGAARARFYPIFNLFGSLDATRYNDARLEQDDFGSSVGVQMTMPLFSGGEDWAGYRKAQHALAEARKTLEDLTNQVVSQVQSAVIRVTAAQEQLRLQRRNARLVLQTRDLVNKEYAAGQASLVRLTQAQRDLVRAQSQWAQARHNLEDAWIQLHATTGRILEEWEGNEPAPPSAESAD